MKKISRMIIAVVMMLCMTVSVMAAAPSPGLEVRPEGGTITLSDGTVISVDDAEGMARYVRMAEPTQEPESIEGYFNLAAVDVELTDGVDEAVVYLYVPGVKKGDTVIVRMFIDGQWADVEAEVVEDNKVKVVVTQSGTLEILKQSSGSDAGTDKDDVKPGENDSATSPKTGETAVLPAAYAAVAVFGAAAVLAGYKAKKTNK